VVEVPTGLATKGAVESGLAASTLPDVPDAPAATTRRVAVALLVMVVLFVLALLVGQVIAPPANAVGSPAHSLFRLVEDVFPPRELTVREIERGGPTCLQGANLVLSPGGGCTFIVPKGVHVVVFRRVPTSPGMMVTFSQTDDLTQTVDTSQAGPDPRHPLELRFATVHDGTTVTLFGCQGPGDCRLTVSK